MKIFTKCVIDMKTLQVVDGELYEYFGPVTECKGGGGGGSGRVDYPDYMKTVHGNWLDNSGLDILSVSVTGIMDAAIGGSPWTAQSAYDPSTDITDYESAIADLKTLLAGITDTSSWNDLFVQAAMSIGSLTNLTVSDASVLDKSVGDAGAVGDISVSDVSVLDKSVGDADVVSDADEITDAEIILDVDAFADQLDDEIVSKVLPRFEGGMRNINSVMSSAFAVGRSIIEGFRDREVAKHNSGLRVNAALKNADVDMANMQKNAQISISNMQKNLDISKANLSKDLGINTANLDKSVQISIANMQKNLDISKANLSKELDISTANLNKEVQISIANLKKDIQVGDINKRLELEYIRSYLEGSDQMLRLMLQRISFNDAYARLVVEGKRIKIVAKKEQMEIDAKIDENDALWDLEVFQYGSNVLASIGSGVANPGARGPSTVQSAIGGALSGAAAGAMIADTKAGSFLGPWGMAAGAALGLASAFL